MYKESVLGSGAGIITYRMPGMNSISAGVWLRAGSRYESLRDNGISHFMEHLVFKGTKRRSGREISRQIEGAGGSLNGFTSQESTCYLARVESAKINKGLDVLLDMVFNPLLKQSDVDKERRVIQEEIGRIIDLPMHYVHVLFDSLIWNGHPLGFNISGSVESIQNISGKALESYRKKFHKPCNVVLACAGNVEHESVVRTAEQLFPAEAPGRSKIPSPVKGSQRKKRLSVENRPTEQTHLCLGVRTFPFSHPDRYVLSVLSVILGGNMSSRLFEQVREKRGLAYHISSSVHRLSDTGNLIISAGVAPARTGEAVRVILREVEKLRSRHVFKKELSMAKEFLRGQTLLSMEDTSSVMMWAGENKLLSGSVPRVEDILEGIRRVTADDVRRVATIIFKEEKFNLALIGPNKRKEIEKAYFE